MMTEGEQAAEEYKSTLDELHSNSKAEINALSMLAEDNREYAVNIAACIDNHLRIVPNRRKLPILYLIDSIYEKVRKSLHKLRMTWNTTGIFPQNKLNAIDERVHEMDPNWPILHKITQQQQNQSHSQQNRNNHQTSNKNNNTGSETTGNRRAHPNNNNNNVNSNNNNNINSQMNGRRKRPRLGPSSVQQPQQISRNNQPIIETPVLVPLPQTFIDPNIIQVMPSQPATHDMTQVHPTTFMDPSITIASNDQLHRLPTATFIEPNLIIAANEPQLQIHPPPAPQQPQPQPPLAQQQTQQLCTTLYNQSHNQSNGPETTQQHQPAHSPVLDSLYGGKQCSNCSLRFDDNNRYAIHLDWHFRQNLKSDNMFARRKWYYPLNLWVQFREINDDDLQDNNNADSNVNLSSSPINDHEVPTAPASKDDEKNICSVCHETFEKFWAEDEEEWRLRNARLYEDERVYHPLCLMDMLQASVA